MALERPYLRDGVDVYVRRDREVHFVFLSTRRRLVVAASEALIRTLAWLDGEHTVLELIQRFETDYGPHQVHRFRAFLDYLEKQGLIIERDWLSRSEISSIARQTQARQLTFLLDVLGTPQKVIAAQQRIENAKVVIFGVGGVGSWILQLLLALGFRQFTIVDHDVTQPSDVARHAFSDQKTPGTERPKVGRLADLIQSKFAGVTVRPVRMPLSIDTALADVVDKDCDLVINTADEPYIGYTSVLLSRYCIEQRIPLLVAGGFDAHLASVGEMIIPGVTPCADCYADHFRVALADWRPVTHPVAERQDGFGGLCALSVFAAATVAMSALRLFAFDEHGAVGGRGEMLFEDYRLDRFEVRRRPDCQYCGAL